MSGGLETSSMTKVIGYMIIQIIFTLANAKNITLWEPQSTIGAEIGEELQITCLGTKCQNPNFIWASLSDNPLSGTINNDGKISVLTMKINSENLDTYDSYRCTVRCDNPPAEKGFKVMVYSFPDPVLSISSLKAGEHARITCTIPDAYPYYAFIARILIGKVIVAEYKDPPIDTDSFSVKDVILTYDLLLNSEYEAQEIKCDVELPFIDNQIDSIQKNTFMRLNPQYPPGKPTILVSPDTTVMAAEDILMACTFESRSPASVQWVKLDEGKELLMPSDDRGTLAIPNAEPEDSGIYMCHVQNHVGESSSQVQITVEAFPDTPTLTIYPTTVQAGQTVTIECLAKGNGNVNFTLWKELENGNILPLDESNKFVIKEAEPSDAGVYKCIAENQYGVSEASESLTVIYSPMEMALTSSVEEVNEGDEVTLICTSNGFPKPSFFLYHLLPSGDGILLSTSPVVTLTNVTSGVYQCEARNSFGSKKEKLQLRVRFPPRNTFVTVTPSLVLNEGNSVHIKCTSEAYPAPTLVLKKKTESGLSELKAENGQYSITQVTEEHAGRYICQSSNVVGQQEAEATITVQVPPKNTHITITPSSGVREGDFIDIRCTSEAAPAPRLSLKVQTENGVRELVSEGGQYQIAHAATKHSGTYICESTNAAGQHRVEATLTVQVSPQKTVLTISPSQVLKEGSSAHIKCTSEAFPAPTLVLKKQTVTHLIDLEMKNGEYSITHVGVEHAGTYICESTNEAGQQTTNLTLSVQVPPKNTFLSISPSSLVREGDNVQIQCSSEAYPSPKLVLMKKTEQGLIEQLETEDGLYNITSVGEPNMGTYICLSANEVGQQTAEALLIVQVPPRNNTVVTPSQNITAGDIVPNTFVTHIIPPPERLQNPKFDYMPPVIIGSAVLLTAGLIGTIAYQLKKAKVQGSYSLIKALRSKV
ncbi:vascular cell adhesion protein 1 [Pyxicephalus adspersus]|uniref:Ig-like domain-containing protein n=1 Tax=Pyxicephalus adspersus TaxID=30357 RepID=A0AAV3A138_PYXAD|nr:TPA: hypothetical protein GDO54_016434 [Pyxicephalus adspersus]